MTRGALVLVLIAACGKTAAPVDKPNGESNMNKPGSGSKPAFVKGIDLVPSDKLVAWLDAQKRGNEARLIRIPIVLPKDGGSYDISKARLGAAAGALEVYANDAALGVGLADRASDRCEGPTCGFLVEGYWRGKKGSGYELEVNKAELLPEDKLAAATFAEVEGESGN